MHASEPRLWLSHHVFPLWLKKGVDRKSGGFVEELSLEGEPLRTPRRCRVQARQIFSFRTGLDLGVCDPTEGRAAVESGTAFLLSRYSLPSGAFRHSVGLNSEPLDDNPCLYDQAFALFGLAHAFAVLRDPDLRDRAKALVAYLRRERGAEGGGFTEWEKGAVVYQQNPHMHLFEAAVAWMEVDSDPQWKALADEILGLCLNKFIDPATGALAENFSKGWAPELKGKHFLYEPGHLYEWSWLMGRYQLRSGRDLLKERRKLFALSERSGICPRRRAVFDQMRSDETPLRRTARFWPQCERIKAATQLGETESAIQGMDVLFRYFDLPVKGLWRDTWGEDDSFPEQAVRASSLYHIIGAISEFLTYR
ncbi:MAG TPA: AGE family epimerase/isomerase [Bdellovibrionota bacterium]|jgi:mannose-6-phosphate isomerase